MDILGEVKKSEAELICLRDDLLALADGSSEATVKANSLKKWKALVAHRPRALWLLGPSEAQYVFLTSFEGDRTSLHEASIAELAHHVA